MMQKNKRTQRSYSSFRVKTQQAEINEDSSWINSNNGQKILNHLNHKISTSQLINTDENDGLYQSVSERVFEPRYNNHYNSCMEANMESISEYGNGSVSNQQSESQVSKSEKVIHHLREKCKNYEKALEFFNRERQESFMNQNNKENIKHSQNVSCSSDNVYLREIDELKRQLGSRNKEMEEYKKKYNTKSSEIEGISNEISERIEKETNEKNLYIKELNLRNIEVKKLAEKLELFTAQLTTKDMVLKEKEEQIEALHKELSSIGNRKLRIEGYEQKIHETEYKLKEIETHTMRLKEELEKKDLQERLKNDEITKMLMKIDEYEEKLKVIENSFVEELEKNKKLSFNLEELRQQNERQKADYVKLTPLKQLIKEKEVEIKGLVDKIQEVKDINAELMVENEQLKQDNDRFVGIEQKLRTVEGERDGSKKIIREKEEEIQAMEGIKQQYMTLESNFSNIEKENNRLKQLVEEKSTKLSLSETHLNTIQSQLESTNEELVKKELELERIKERTNSIDQIYKENQRLNSNIHEKLNEIEKLQQRITTLENKLCNLTNENSKLKILKEELSAELIKLQNILEGVNIELNREKDINERLHQELQSKQESFIMLTHECTAYKATVNQLEEDNDRICNEANELEEELEQNRVESEQIYQQLQELSVEKTKAENMIIMAQESIDRLNEEVNLCKNSIDELISKEQQHQEMIYSLEGEIKKLQQEKYLAIDQKNKLSSVIEKIYSLSADAKNV